jgi:putative ATPase
MGDLFGDAAAERAARTGPLAHRVRPRTLDELVGQETVVGLGTALGRAIAEGRAPSMILHGPPGVGKTTIARIVAESSEAAFEELSAVSARIDDVRAVIARARDRLGGNGVRTLLFIDEIHRFDKRQQDSVLHAVEDGLVTLIGATTENPYFEVNQALLSRCTVIELEPLSLADLERVIERGAEALGPSVPGDVSEEIARRAGGDARTALQTLELAWETASTAGQPLAVGHVEDAARKRPLRYDRDGDRQYDLTSAFIQVDARERPGRGGLLPCRRCWKAGRDPRFLARRIVIAASEEVGEADPTALVVAVAAAQALEHVGLPEAQLSLAQGRFTSRSRRSRMPSRRRSGRRGEDVRRDGIQPPPPPLRDSHYRPREPRARGRLCLAARRPLVRARRSPPRGDAGSDLLSSVLHERGSGGGEA